MVESAKKIIAALLILFVFTLTRCALQLPPGGGEVDKEPPEIISVYPEPGTTGFQDAYIELEFSEYIQKRTLKEAIFISPSIDGSLELDWSGESVEVHFPDSLRKDMTYTVTIGTDVKDYNNGNRMAKAFTFVFSTGDQIDYGEIHGTVYDDKAAGVMVFAYKLPADSADTLNPATTKPDYISQVGNSGEFELSGLSFGDYRIYAVEDEFRDLLFQSAQDRIGVPSGDVTLNETDSLVRFVNFYLQELDTTAPRLSGAVMTDRYHILLEFNEDVDTAVIKADKYVIIDSTSGKKYFPLYAYRGRAKSMEVVLSITDSLSEENELYVLGNRLTDGAGNVTDSEYISLTVSSNVDTTAPMPAKILPTRSFAIDIVNTKLTAVFNDAFDFAAAKEYIVLADTSGNTVPLTLTKITDASFEIVVEENLKPKTDYQLTFNLNYFRDAAGNSIDSIYTHRFTTLNDLNFTGASGFVKALDALRNPQLVLQNTQLTERRYQQPLDSSGSFGFERVYPGQYILSLFYDTDSSKSYSYGKAFPIAYSEEFRYFQDTLELPPRWSVQDILFNLDFYEQEEAKADTSGGELPQDE